MITYEQSRRDFEFLETLAELTDQVELDADRINLMRTPTKAKAADMYQAGIRLWFGEHGGAWSDAIDVCELADRYGIDWPEDTQP